MQKFTYSDQIIKGVSYTGFNAHEIEDFVGSLNFQLIRGRPHIKALPEDCHKYMQSGAVLAYPTVVLEIGDVVYENREGHTAVMPARRGLVPLEEAL